MKGYNKLVVSTVTFPKFTKVLAYLGTGWFCQSEFDVAYDLVPILSNSHYLTPTVSAQPVISLRWSFCCYLLNDRNAGRFFFLIFLLSDPNIHSSLLLFVNQSSYNRCGMSLYVRLFTSRLFLTAEWYQVLALSLRRTLNPCEPLAAVHVAGTAGAGVVGVNFQFQIWLKWLSGWKYVSHPSPPLFLCGE